MRPTKVGIIVGSGLNDPQLIQNPTEHNVSTIFGDPSDTIIDGEIRGVPCAVLARHGRRHSILPSDINFRANIWALKELGCTHILATSACGGLQEYTHSGDFVILDQFIDQTRGRDQTLYGGTKPALKGVLHIPMGEPFCEETRRVLIDAASQVSLNVWDRAQGPPASAHHPCVHTHGSALVINGPRFSTRCESKLFHSWGVDVITMTVAPEVSLAREAGLSYASIAIVTDYDAWKANTEVVSVEAVLNEFRRNVEKVKTLLVKAVELVGRRDWTGVIEANERLVLQNRQDLLHCSD